MGKSEIDRIIDDAWGGDSKAAQVALAVTKQTISDWRRKGIPKMRRYQLAAITGFQPAANDSPPSPSERAEASSPS
ncbi:hypothetical protein M0Q28_06855 [Patescibacteria group bacterium]|jgi:hypothetical protein|nr:hypothetical protein [Patescibacteria group bacterium]